MLVRVRSSSSLRVRSHAHACHPICTAKYDVDDGVLLGELMQLGLPKDISTSICRCYVPAKGKLRELFAKHSLSRKLNTTTA